jgi:hypothetical protein
MLRNNTSLIKDNTPPIAEIISVKNLGGIVVCGFLMKYFFRNMLKI